MPVIENRAYFAEHAAPEAVRAYLTQAQTAAARANAEVRWLTGLLAEKTAHLRHHHVCAGCSDGTRPGPGCGSCRNSGMSQNPCTEEGHQPQCPHGCCPHIVDQWKEPA